MQAQVSYRPATEAERRTPEFRHEVLTVKFGIWTKRLEYAREIRDAKQIADCERAVADLTVKLSAVRL
jgi:hypothetical protein